MNKYAFVIIADRIHNLGVVVEDSKEDAMRKAFRGLGFLSHLEYCMCLPGELRCGSEHSEKFLRRDGVLTVNLHNKRRGDILSSEAFFAIQHRVPDLVGDGGNGSELSSDFVWDYCFPVLFPTIDEIRKIPNCEYIDRGCLWFCEDWKEEYW